MSEPLIREPIGVRILLRVLRPEDDIPILLWRAGTAREVETLIEAGETPEKARLWASLLRWSEAENIRAELIEQGWTVQRLLVRVMMLGRVASRLKPPAGGAGWTMSVNGLELVAVPEVPPSVPNGLERLLAFLDEPS